MNVIEALNWRYAVRKFSDQKLSDEEVKRLVDATLLSPTSYGLQPYRLFVITDQELRRRLMASSFGQEKVLHCSHLVVFAAQTAFGDELVDLYIESVAETRKIEIQALSGLAEHMKEVFRNKNARQKKEWAHQQAYIALGTLLTSAALMKIDSCPMGAIDAAAYDEALNLKALNLETSMICALGFRDQKDKTAGMQKVRYDESEMVVTI